LKVMLTKQQELLSNKNRQHKSLYTRYISNLYISTGIIIVSRLGFDYDSD
jgi:hypothetical protein